MIFENYDGIDPDMLDAALDFADYCEDYGRDYPNPADY